MARRNSASRVGRHWQLIAVCVLAGTFGASLHVRSSPVRYRASASLFLAAQGAETANDARRRLNASERLVESYARLGESQLLQLRSRRRLPIELQRARGSIQVIPVPDSLLMRVSAVSPRRDMAIALSNAAAEALADVIGRLEADPEGPRIIDTANRAVTLRTNAIGDLIFGTLFGAVVAAILVFLLELYQRKVHTAEGLTEVTGVSVLGSIPYLPEHEYGLAPEPFLQLRTNIGFLNSDCRSIVVTSPSTQDGKTFVAAGLARAAATSGARVVLIDADLRSRDLSHMFGAGKREGLSDVLLARRSLDDTVIRLGTTLDFLPAGPAVGASATLLGRPALRRVVEELLKRADLVVVDAPPTLATSDPRIIGAAVDGVLLVTRRGETNVDDVAAAAESLRTTGANVLGAALNAV